MKSGKSLTEHITDLILKSLSENDFQNNESHFNNKIKDLEERILNIESTVSNREYVSQKLKPFNNFEAINCTKFMRGLFYKELEKRKITNNDKEKAFNDLYQHIKSHKELSNSFSDRLREIMLTDNPTPWSADELNNLTNHMKCNCSIRKGLINWTDKKNFPSQQEICDKGEDLLSIF